MKTFSGNRPFSRSTSVPRRRMRGISTILAVIAAAMTSLVATPVAHAHDTYGIPYHKKPAPAGLQPFASAGQCNYGFYNPIVFGYTNEYVYWRLWIAVPRNGAWAYEYGEWRRAWVASNQMIGGWESQQWPNNDWWLANGVSTIYGPGSTESWLGWEVYYSSKRTSHFEWLGKVNSAC